MKNKKDIAVIIYHKNHKRYPENWINDFVNSIKNQVVEDFDVIELDYGGEGQQIYHGSIMFSHKIDDVKPGVHTGHSEAHNWCCRKAVELGYKYVFNTNIDDCYHHERIYRQLPYLKQGYDVVSCNYTQIDKDNYVIKADVNFSSMNIEAEARKGHNIISHPACCYSESFILNSGLLNPYEVPQDDGMLWRRSFGKFKFFIVPYTLHYYRIWGGNVSYKMNNKYQ